jgi:acyl-coenzyme A synthetase/AMP-(fatty) acid ligase
MTSTVDDVHNVASRLIDTLIAANRGDRQAFSYNGKRYSYQDVAALMNRAGNMVRGLGVGAKERVLVLLPASPAYVASVLGLMKAGAVPVIGVPVDVAGLRQCVGATKPTAAIIHERHVGTLGDVLDANLRGRILVVGADARGHKSFVDQLRAQSSWLPPQDVTSDAPALATWTAAGLDSMSHAELVLRIDQGVDAVADDDDGSEKASLLSMLRAFSVGEETALR